MKGHARSAGVKSHEYDEAACIVLGLSVHHGGAYPAAVRKTRMVERAFQSGADRAHGWHLV